MTKSPKSPNPKRTIPKDTASVLIRKRKAPSSVSSPKSLSKGSSSQESSTTQVSLRDFVQKKRKKASSVTSNTATSTMNSSTVQGKKRKEPPPPEDIQEDSYLYDDNGIEYDSFEPAISISSQSSDGKSLTVTTSTSDSSFISNKSSKKDTHLSNVITGILRSNASFLSPTVLHNVIPLDDLVLKVRRLLKEEEYDFDDLSKKISKSFHNIKSRIAKIDTSSFIDPFYQIHIINASDELLAKLGITKTYISRWRRVCFDAQRRMNSEENGLYLLFVILSLYSMYY